MGICRWQGIGGRHISGIGMGPRGKSYWRRGVEGDRGAHLHTDSCQEWVPDTGTRCDITDRVGGTGKKGPSASPGQGPVLKGPT